MPRKSEPTRALRLTVHFPSVRKADWETWKRELFQAGNDLRQARNLTMAAIYTAKLARYQRWQAERDGRPVPQGFADWPKERAKDGSERDLHQSTYLYGLMKGTQGPTALYRPTEGRIELGGGVLSAAAREVDQRINADWKRLLRGDCALPTFKSPSIPIRAQELLILPDGRITATIWGKDTKRNRVVMRARARGAGNTNLWRQVCAGEVENGAAALEWNARRKRWEIILAVRIQVGAYRVLRPTSVLDVDVDPARGEVLARIIDTTTGTQSEFVRRFPIPRPVRRAFQRMLIERRQRMTSGRREYGLREGRGVARKIRPVTVLSDRYRNLVDDAAKRLARAVTDYAVQEGVAGWGAADAPMSADEFLSVTDKLVAGERKLMRQVFQASNRGRILQAVTVAMEAAGVPKAERVKISAHSKRGRKGGQRRHKAKHNPVQAPEEATGAVL